MELITSNGNAEHNGIYVPYLVNGPPHRGSQVVNTNSLRNSLSTSGRNKIILMKKRLDRFSLNDFIDNETCNKCVNKVQDVSKQLKDKSVKQKKIKTCKVMVT